MSKLTSVATKDIPATPMIKHGSWGSSDQGSHESSLELFNWGDPLYYQVEWDIPGLEATEHIGCTFEWVSVGMEPKKSMTDYDGIMAMPDIVVTFLREQGFIIPEEFE